MKKILLVLGIILSCNIASANCSFNCVEPYDLSSGISRFMSNVTGSNAAAEQVAKIILKKEICKNLDGKVKVDVDSYSVKDLKKGIFKSFKMTGKDVDIEGVHFTQLNISTVCDFNYISMVDANNPIFKEDLPLAFSVVMSESDVNKSMQTPEYKKIIEDLNRLGGSSGMFRVASSEIKIRDNKLYYVLKIAIPFVRGTQNIVMTTDLKVRKGEVDFSNTKLVNENLVLDLKKLDKVINFLNPLDFSLNILENKDAQLTVQNAQIKDNKIHADGFIVIPKD